MKYVHEIPVIDQPVLNKQTKQYFIDTPLVGLFSDNRRVENFGLCAQWPRFLSWTDRLDSEVLDQSYI